MGDLEENTKEPTFAELFEASAVPLPAAGHLSPGDAVTGEVVKITKESVFVDLGGKSEGVADLAEFLEPDGKLSVAVGDRVELKVASVADGIVLSRTLRLRGAEALEMLRSAQQAGLAVEGRVTAVNKGGFEVDLSGRRAFCPVSQIDLGFCENPADHVGARYSFRILEIRDRGRNIVVSRRILLEEERQKLARETLEHLAPGMVVEGKVVRLVPFGAFVDIGGVEGMLHVSEIAHYRVTDPSEVLAVGQPVKVAVLSVDRGGGSQEAKPRISLSMKSLEPSPWEKGFPFREGDVLQAKVSRIADFGAFVELLPGVEGLVHVSEITYQRIRHPSQVLSVGQEVAVRILEIDAERRRISLSIKEAAGVEAASRVSGRDAGAEAATPQARLEPGAVLTGIVERIKPFGVFLRLPQAGPGARGLLPLEESGLADRSDLKKHFPEGSSHQVQILAVDEKGRVRLSVKTLGEHDEQESYRRYAGEKGKSAGLGTLGDLFGNLKLPVRKP